jgi:SAM-dependent methyltransferase
VPAPRREDSSPVSPYIPLPAGLAEPRSSAAEVFDGIAGLYDQARPGYPPEAVTDLVRICGVDSSSRVLEIGCGTGQLTRDLAASGARIVCVEAGSSLAEAARVNLSRWPNVEVVTARFEDFDVPTSSFDVVVSATAFHWVAPEVSYAKAAVLLDERGRLALLTNAHSRGGTHTDESIVDPIRHLHRLLAPEVGDWDFPTTEDIHHRALAGGDIAAVWARVERKLFDPLPVEQLFGQPMVKTYPWLATYDRDAYLAVLSSQSSYALMDRVRHDELLAGIGALIDEKLEGTVTKEYVTVMAIAARAARWDSACQAPAVSAPECPDNAAGA